MNNLVNFEEYEIDRTLWRLSWHNESLTINRKTFDLLLYLVDHSDRVVGKDELLRKLWPESFVEESNLTQHIFLLRKALSRHESGTKIIETVPGRGYRFAVVIKEQQPAIDRTVIHTAESSNGITLNNGITLEEEEEGEKRSRLLKKSKLILRYSALSLISGGSIGRLVDCSSSRRFASQAGSDGWIARVVLQSR